MERSKNSRSRSVPGSHPHAGRNPTENECGGIHRISQREKQFDDFSTTRESEVQIWESIILVQRVLRGHRRKEYEKDRGIHSVPFPVSWTVKMKKKQKETQDILSYHTQAAGCSDKARAKASGGRQPIEECGRTGL